MIKIMVLVLASFILLTGCQSGQLQLNTLNVDVVHENQDRFLDDIPRSATSPSARSMKVDYGEDLYLTIRENSPFKVESWQIYDGFGNLITEKDSPAEVKVFTNQKVVANIVCELDSACIQGYSCINNRCVFS